MAISDERLGLWLNFWKVIISSVVVTGGITLATTLINASLQQKEIEIKEVEKRAEINTKLIEQEKDYLISFLENALDENTERKYQFALFFKSLTYSEQFSSGWDEYFAAVSRERAAILKERDEIQAGLAEKSGEELAAAQKRIVRLEGELSSRRTQSYAIAHTSVPLERVVDNVSCPEGSSITLSTIDYETVNSPSSFESEASDSSALQRADLQHVNVVKLLSEIALISQVLPVRIMASCQDAQGNVKGKYYLLGEDGEVTQEITREQHEAYLVSRELKRLHDSAMTPIRNIR